MKMSNITFKLNIQLKSLTNSNISPTEILEYIEEYTHLSTTIKVSYDNIFFSHPHRSYIIKSDYIKEESEYVQKKLNLIYIYITFNTDEEYKVFIIILQNLKEHFKMLEGKLYNIHKNIKFIKFEFHKLNYSNRYYDKEFFNIARNKNHKLIKIFDKCEDILLKHF